MAKTLSILKKGVGIIDFFKCKKISVIYSNMGISLDKNPIKKYLQAFLNSF